MGRMATTSCSNISRRSFLQYVGFGVMTGVAGGTLGPLIRESQAAGPQALVAWLDGAGVPGFEPVAYPLPLPTAPVSRAAYEVIDDLQLPRGFTYEVLATWGDRFAGGVTFGTGADYTGLVPIPGTADEFWLIVNHEYISARPWLQGAKEVHGANLVDDEGKIAGVPLLGASIDLVQSDNPIAPELFAGLRALATTAMGDLGVSVLHVRRLPNRAIEVIKDSPRHFRIHAFGAINTAGATMTFTGPAAVLLGQPRGTFANCSGATTPWGTFLTCEENFQDQVTEFITPAGAPLPDDRKNFAGNGEPHPTNLPFEFEGLGTAIDPPLDGRQYGWVAEIDPETRALAKHTFLGRFRHENVAIRAEAGKPLVAYMGDDRRGGHVWKFVSEAPVVDPKSKANSRLFERGTLYAAKFSEDFTGEWIAITPSSRLTRPDTQRTAGDHLWLPYRPAGGHIAVGGGKAAEMSVRRWFGSIEMFTDKPFDVCTLGDLCAPHLSAHQKQAVLLADAYVFANAAGATPTARPEDIEIHPRDHSVYIAFTDSTGSGDGSPDKHIFPDSRGDNSRQYGAIYRLQEIDDNPASTRFTWGKFVTAGEIYEHGGGFACADNLVFDPNANVWMVCDIGTPRHNYPVSRKLDDKTNPGGSGFVGIFGNNAMFAIPTAGDHAGKPFCFAIGPMECEITGPTFTDDGQTLLVSIQHPGELHGTRGRAGVEQPRQETRPMLLANADGSPFEQTRTVPLGSNFPANQPGAVPKACVVSIRRAE